MDDKNTNIAIDGEEVIADTHEELAKELQKAALEQKIGFEEKVMASVASNFKQCKRDFEILQQDCAHTISAKVFVVLSRIPKRAEDLINRADGLHTNIHEVKLASNSMWRHLMQSELSDYIAMVEAWKTKVNIVVDQLKDGTIGWTDAADTIVKQDIEIPFEAKGEKDNAITDKKHEIETEKLTSGIGDVRESHLFTSIGKRANDTENVVIEKEVDKKPEPAKPVERVKEVSVKYSLDFIKVADIPVTARQLKVLGYLRRSANAILGIKTEEGVDLFYIGSIINNLIIPKPFHQIKPLFDTAWGTYFLCTVIKPKPNDLIDDDMSGGDFFEISRYMYLNHDGVAEEIDAPFGAHKHAYGSKFKLGSHEEEYPQGSEDYITNAISQSGQLVWMQEGSIQYLINSELGTALGYSASADFNEEGCVKLSGVSKFFLSRPSLSTIIVRDEDSGKEEYVSMKSKLVFERSVPYVTLIGGMVFVGPHETKTTVSTFVPYEVEFGSTKSLNRSNYVEFSNGVLFLRDKILFMDSGDYITQISRMDLELGTKGVICINDTLFMMDKAGSL